MGEKMVPKYDWVLKMHNGDKNPFEDLLYLYCQKMCFKFLSDSGYILGLKE